MRQVVRLVQVRAGGRLEPGPAGRLNEHRGLRDLAGYILEQPPASASPGHVRAWGYLLVMGGAAQLRPVGRLAPVKAWQPAGPAQSRPVGPASPASAPRLSWPPLLRPVRSGRAYRLTSPPARGLVRPALAEALETVFEGFAREAGFTPDQPLDIQLGRGFKAGSHGHGEGRAADIAAVGGKSLLEWKKEWDKAIASAEKLSDPQQRTEASPAEQKRNLGYGLYKALQAHGGWRVNPRGWRVYRNVEQLFGPWTATEGPWKAMEVKDPDPYQRRRLADQQWVFRAHQDHIHVAR